MSSTTNNKGFLPPKMLAAQRITIATPAAGLLVYQTDAPNGLYYYDGSSWIFIIQSNITGNAATATLATTETNIASGSDDNIPYQSATGTTSMLANRTNEDVLASKRTTFAPVWAVASGGIPYSGANGAVNLGVYDLTVNSLTVGKSSGGIS